jgi:hypothetical protein
MNAEDLERIEDMLRLTIPADFARFLATQPEDDGRSLWEPKEMPGVAALAMFSTADRVIVENLQLRQGGFTDKWPASHLAIGDDLCGNVFFLDTTRSPSPAVQLWAHDPVDDVTLAADSFPDLIADFARMAPRDDAGERTPETEPDHKTGRCWSVTRAPVPWKSIMHPIGLDEWETYARSDRTIHFLGRKTAKNPFTGETMRSVWPGHAEWQSGSGERVPIQYRFGRLEMEGAHPAGEEKMRQIAAALSAQLVIEDA